jgi:hypothetical protein
MVAGANLKNGHIRSCGCLNVEVLQQRRTTHGATTGGTSTTTYNVWLGMKARCSNPQNPLWKHYGGRGITVCDRWRSFENFLADMGERPVRLSLERVNNDAGYSPANCIWADKKTQMRNMRTTTFITVDGKRVTLLQACEDHGIDIKRVRNRKQRSADTMTEAFLHILAMPASGRSYPPLSAETKARISAANVGRVMSAETRAKIAATLRARHRASR